MGSFLLLLSMMSWAAQTQNQAQPQQQNDADLEAQVEKLKQAMQQVAAQMAESQRQLDQLKSQLAGLQKQLADQNGASANANGSENAAARLQAQIDELKSQQAMQETQLATHNQAKVESQSSYPVALTGLILLNGFVNTSAVAQAATPTIAVPGSGSTGLSLQQTVLGFDARGPHLFGARSFADARVDFDGSTSTDNAYPTTGYGNFGLLRLRTAHASLRWENTQAYFALDKTLINPESPTSLTAIAEPPLAWSGNLWSWNPQVGITHDVELAPGHFLRLQTALIDTADAPVNPESAYPTNASASERSRWPGVESRIALVGLKRDEGTHFSVGGYFAPHLTPYGERFDAWAATIDYHIAVSRFLTWEGSVYRGLALGGLGGGAFKDYVYRYDGTQAYFRPLDDVGGWTQIKAKVNERLQFNAALGLDQVFSGQLRPYYVDMPNSFLANLARNQTTTANVIYSPSAYLLFSLEYRYLRSSPVIGAPEISNIIGIGAGYKF
jgi:hypothetical protein